MEKEKRKKKQYKTEPEQVSKTEPERPAAKPGNGLSEPEGRKGPQTHGPAFTDRIWAMQKDRVGLDWLVKGLGCRHGPSRPHGS
jgi:hypothetical protein